MAQASVIGVVVILLCATLHLCYCCNEAICASIVSKCMLTGACKCDTNNHSCTKDCFLCLDDLYEECCSCVEICPKPNRTVSALSRQSSVEDLSDSSPSLFAALTEVEDTKSRWFAFTFPVDLPISSVNNNKRIKLIALNAEQDTLEVKELVTVNCTVAYMSQCMPWNKCRGSCMSMGASSYRWFHDGCCQCVGENCINYGINESRCKGCPGSDELTDIVEPEMIEYDEYEYVEDNVPKKKKHHRKANGL